jgi:hypothetical protein
MVAVTAVVTIMATTTPTRQQPQVRSHHKVARLLFGGAGLLLVFGACSDDSAPAVQSLPPIATTTTTVLAAGPSVAVDTGAAAASTTVVVAATPAPVDGAAVLQQAVAGTGGGYHFNQTATVDGVVALTVDGDRLPDGARLTVSNDAGSVSYIFTTDGVFIMPEGGEWEADDSDPPTADPINALAAPSSVAVAANDGTTVQLVVTVPLSSLGIAGDGTVPLNVSVVNGALSTITYSTTSSDGRVASTTVTIGPPVDPSPVVSPI